MDMYVCNAFKICKRTQSSSNNSNVSCCADFVLFEEDSHEERTLSQALSGHSQGLDTEFLKIQNGGSSVRNLKSKS